MRRVCAAARLRAVHGARFGSDDAPADAGKSARMAGIEMQAAKEQHMKDQNESTLETYRLRKAALEKMQSQEGKEWESYRGKRLEEVSDFQDMSRMQGMATARGTEKFFEDRRIGLDQPWVRELPRTGLRVSAVTQACKRVSSKASQHRSAIIACEKAAVNVFDVSLYDQASMGCFLEGLSTLTGITGVPRSNMVIIGRCGWVVFKDWLNINNVAPDFSKIPNSRELCNYGPDISRPVDPGPSHIGLMKKKVETEASPHDPDNIGESLLRRYRHFMPDQPALEIQNLSDAALLKLTGLITANKKLGHYWCGQEDVLQAQVGAVREAGLQTLDFLVLDAVQMIHSVARDSEEFITYLAQAFAVMEEMAKRKIIQYYGVDSAMFFGGSDTKHYVDPRWVVEAAERAGGKDNKLRLFMLPFNLTERHALLSKMADDHPKSVFDYLKAQELGCITYRPLSTYDAEGKEQRYINHRRIKDPPTFGQAYTESFQKMLLLEEQNERLLANTVLRPAKELYHFANSLQVAQSFLNNYYQYDDFMRARYDGLMGSCLESISDSKDQVLMQWVSAYRMGYDSLKALHGQALQHTHAVADDKILQAIERNTGDTKLGDELSQMALNAVLGTNVMHSCSVSMRHAIYLDSLISRNAEVLKPLPVSVLGGLFTDSETSFVMRTPPKRLQVDAEAYFKNRGLDTDNKEQMIGHAKDINDGKESFYGVRAYHQEGEELPDWVKEV